MIYYIFKIVATVFCIGFILSGIVRASAAHHNLDIPHGVEYFVGALGVIGGLIGISYLWLF